MYSRKTVFFSLVILIALVSITYISLLSRFQESRVLQDPDNINAQTACNTGIFDFTYIPQGVSMSKGCVQANAYMYTGDSRFVFFDAPGGSGILPKGHPFVQTENVSIKDNGALTWGIRLNAPADVYVYYRRALEPSSTQIPAWLTDGYTTVTGTSPININNLPSYLMRKNDFGLIGLYDAYKISGTAGRTFTFGAASKPGISALSMYIVAVVGTSPTPTPSPTQSSGANVEFVGAGDIATCGGPAEATAALVAPVYNSGGYVFAAGDNAYSSSGFYTTNGCYDKTWGKYKDRTYPAVGTHEISDGIESYYNYFGQRVRGPAGKGYYSYDIGSWHWITLNSDLTGTDATNQLAWLQADLQAHRTVCTGVVQHRARYTTGSGGDQNDLANYYNALYDAGADISIAAHKPYYERTHPVSKTRTIDINRGITNFVVGTGGNKGSVYDENPSSIRAAFQVGSSSGFWGVLKFTLKPNGYDYVFTTASNSPHSSFTDSGVASCH